MTGPAVSEPGVRRWLLAFERDPGEALVQRWELLVDADMLRAWQHAADDDPMFYVYPVAAANVELLAPYLPTDFEWRFDEFDYFVSATRG